MVTTKYYKTVGLLGLAYLALSLGCGESNKEGDASVQGTVIIDGELARRGTVAFHPVGEGPAAYGSINENGTFALRIGRGDSGDPDHSMIYSGDYVASVVVRGVSTLDEEHGESTPPTPGALLSASKYSNKATSGLEFTINPGVNVIDIPIEGAVNEEVLDAEGDEPAEEEQPNSEEDETPPETQTPEESNETDAPAEESEP